MKTHSHILKYKTKKFMEFIDITPDVEKLVLDKNFKNGFLTIFCKHTTAAIRINEKEKGIYKDFEKFALKLLHPKKYYHHNDLSIRTENLVCEPGASDCLNGHSHCLHLLMGATSESIPVVDGKMVFGPFQRIFLIELDCSRNRQVLIHMMGE
jgi:secondary thiamine-phosphate synthase enzyme